MHNDGIPTHILHLVIAHGQLLYRDSSAALPRAFLAVPTVHQRASLFGSSLLIVYSLHANTGGALRASANVVVGTAAKSTAMRLLGGGDQLSKIATCAS